MKKFNFNIKKYFFVILFFNVISCQNNASNNARDTLSNNVITKPVKTITYNFQVDNANKDSIGFLINEDIESYSIKNICIVDDFLFLTDQAHGNIKRINLNNGKVNVSKTIKPKGKLGVITCFNNLLYLLTYDNDLYILDINLNIVDSFSIPNYLGAKNIYYQTKDFLIIYRPIEDCNQLKDLSFQISTVKIDQNNKFYRDTVYIKNYTAYQEYKQNIRGTKYQIKNLNNQYVFRINDKNFEIKSKIPSTSYYYESKNIDFSDDKLAFFDSNPKKFTLYVYFYK